MDEHTEGENTHKRQYIDSQTMVRKSEMMDRQSGQTPIKIIQWTQIG